MVNKIYGDKVFDLTATGSVFYKQGTLADAPNLGPGIYQAMKYDWQSGKQIFRATGTEKVYEKRLIKDSYGKPQWTGWYEIPGGEAGGVQSIAVNDGVLRLPNEDGAIKLEITAAALNAFTKQETERLVEHKLNEYSEDKYSYVPWPLLPGTITPKDWTPKQVLEDAFPTGGETQHIYIVAAKPATPPMVSAYPKVSQFVWDVVGGGAGGQLLYGWIETSGLAQVESFVPYTTFNAHRFDADRDAPNVKHVTAEEKERIATAVKQLEFAAHKAGEDVDPTTGATLKHVTEAEKRYWDGKMNSVPLTIRNKRYVAYTVDGVSTSWQEAFEQLSLGELDHNYWRPFGTAAHRVEGSSYTFEKKFKNYTLSLLEGGSVPQDLIVSFTSLDTRGADAYFILNDDPTLKSPVWNTAHPNQPAFSFSFPLILGVDDNQEPIYLEKITYVTSAPPTNGTLIGGLLFDATYFETNQVNFGLDTNHSVNFIGNQLKLNNKVINTDLPSYTNIVGRPEDNSAIVKYVRERLQDKVGPTPPVPDVRYDVIDGRWLAQSLIQHTAKTNGDYRLASVSNVQGANKYVRGGFQTFFTKAFADDNAIKDWEVTDVSVRFPQGIDLPDYQNEIWFYVDDQKAEKSTVFFRDEITGILEWHLGPATDWDGIYVGNPHSDPSVDSFRTIPQIEVIVKGIKFTGVEVGRGDKTMELFSSKKPVVTYGENDLKKKSSPIATMADVTAAIDKAFTVTTPTDQSNQNNPGDSSNPGESVAYKVVTKAKFDSIDDGVVFTSISIDPRTSTVDSDDYHVLRGSNGIKFKNEVVNGVDVTSVGIDQDYQLTENIVAKTLEVKNSATIANAMMRGSTVVGAPGGDTGSLTVNVPTHLVGQATAQYMTVGELHITGSMEVDDIDIPDNFTADNINVRESVFIGAGAEIDATNGEVRVTTKLLKDNSSSAASTEFVKNITGELTDLAAQVPQSSLVAAINYVLGNGGRATGGGSNSGVAVVNSIYVTASEIPIALNRNNVFVGPAAIEVGSPIKVVAAYNAQNVLSHIGVIGSISQTQVTATFSSIKNGAFVYDSSASYKAGALVLLLGSQIQPADIYYCVSDAPVGSPINNPAFFKRISHDLSDVATETTASKPATYRVVRLDVKDGGVHYVVGDGVEVVGSDGSTILGTVAQVNPSGAIVRIELQDAATHLTDPKTEFPAAVQGGSGSDAFVAIVTRFAPGPSYQDGTLQHVPIDDPLMQKSAVYKAIDDALGESITLRAIGIVSATAPLPTKYTLRDGMLWYESTSGSPPNAFPFAVKRWDDVGKTWSTATAEYAPRGFDAWFSTNVLPSGAMYYWNLSTWVDLNFIIDDSTVIHTGGAETILGVKTFAQTPVLPAASGSLLGTTASQTSAATQKQVQDTAATRQAAINAGSTNYVLAPPIVTGGQPQLVQIPAIPSGGKAGQVLMKLSDDDYDVAWVSIEDLIH